MNNNTATKVYDLKRNNIKIVGASGQGINTVGEILALSLKRAGLSVYATREYPSLIKGGHATYQIDFSPEQITAKSRYIDGLIVLNRQKTNWHLQDMKPGGFIFHDIDNPRIDSEEAELMRQKQIKLIYIPALELAKNVGGNELMTNIVTLGYVWKLLKLQEKVMESVIRKQFADKPKYVEIDVNCMYEGFRYSLEKKPTFAKRLRRPNEIEDSDKLKLHTFDEKICLKYFNIDTDEKYKDSYLITGNDALSIGAVNAGVRVHYGYPMTPSSSILNYLAVKAKETGMIVKQAEDEITAAAMAIGSMYMGTRALTATSGGGFDLMTEHVSLAAITEIPFVCVIAQRPGPATGMPTWTTQGDLLLSVFASHGEFARCVIAVGDPEECFSGIQEAYNIAERHQIPVLVLTDKQLAETLYTVNKFDQEEVNIDRGWLVTDEDELKKLKPSDRYKLTEDGISPRWNPGSSEADFDANSDEHTEEGNVTEDAEPAAAMISKRIRKQETLRHQLPQPELLFNNTELATARAKISFIGWGSTLGVMQDVMQYYEGEDIKVDYIHVKYIWPLQTDLISNYLSEHPDTILIENNHNGQLGQLIKMQAGLDIENKLLKWDGREFTVEDVIDYVDSLKLI